MRRKILFSHCISLCAGIYRPKRMEACDRWLCDCAGFNRVSDTGDFVRGDRFMKITVITVGKMKEKYLKDAIAEYSKRLSKYCKLEILEVADEKTPDNASETVENMIRAKEGERILKHVKEDAYVITLEIEGRQLTSEKLAEKIETLGVQGNSHIIFIIGGSIGLGPEVLKRSDYALSFSRMTFPHQLMRVILLEQIYRSYRIINGEPYHK